MEDRARRDLTHGYSGLRDEVTYARRENLGLAQIKTKRSAKKVVEMKSAETILMDDPRGGEEGATDAAPVAVWALTVIGKRQKERTVPVSGAAIAALRAHWQDGVRDFDAPGEHGPLIAPIVVNGTQASSTKHGEEGAERGRSHTRPMRLRSVV